MLIGCIIQARMGSSRLPGKVMMCLDENNFLIDYVLNQLSYSKSIDKTIVATTKLKEDNLIVNHVRKYDLEVFCGSSDDVLDRYYRCAEKNNLEHIVRITSDNPLIDPKIVDMVIEKYMNTEYDYVTNALMRTYPYGTETEVFSMNSLEKTWKKAVLPSEREHVTPYMKNSENKFKVLNIKYNENISNLRWTVDRINDLKLVKCIVKQIKTRPITMKEILELNKKDPNLKKINQDYVQNEGFVKSLKEDQKYLNNEKS